MRAVPTFSHLTIVNIGSLNSIYRRANFMFGIRRRHYHSTETETRRALIQQSKHRAYSTGIN